MQAITEGLIYISYKDITFYHNKHSLSKTQGNNQDDKMVESVCVHAHECSWTVMGPYMCLLWHISIAIFFLSELPQKMVKQHSLISVEVEQNVKSIFD